MFVEIFFENTHLQKQNTANQATSSINKTTAKMADLELDPFWIMEKAWDDAVEFGQRKKLF